MNARLISLVSTLNKHKDLSKRQIERNKERELLLNEYKELKKDIIQAAKNGRYYYGVPQIVRTEFGGFKEEHKAKEKSARLIIVLRLFRYKHRDFTVDINLSSDVSIFRHLITWGETAKTIKISENR